VSAAVRYRILAADCQARARNESGDARRREWERMARGYRHLVELADRNDERNGVTAELPFTQITLRFT
jgi:hypothetical protein